MPSPQGPYYSERLRFFTPFGSYEGPWLDDIVPPITGPTLLKIDTQGYERPILDGATRLLPQFTGIQLELSLTPIYQNQPPVEEMIAYLRAKGSHPTRYGQASSTSANGAFLEMDGTFTPH